jgi:hypothetical protein
MIINFCIISAMLFGLNDASGILELNDQECCQNIHEVVIQEVQLDVAVFLEGALVTEDFSMTTNLNKLGYLPGQKPKAFFGKTTVSGQPYKKNPWNYQGKEGVAKENKPYQYPLEVVDWVLISLRQNEHASSTVYTSSALIYKDGSIKLAPDAPNCKLDINDQYYLVVEHRNHLAVMSNSPISGKDGVLSYDFRYSPSFEEGQKSIKDGIYAMYAGNADQVNSPDAPKIIDEEDLRAWQSGNGQNSSYFIMDLDLSGDVSIKDQELLYNNLGIFSTVPF